jgi:heme-degrading monooxygenase HmoA
MISRVWRGWTPTEQADAYEAFLRDQLFPRVAELDGYLGAYLMRVSRDEEVEFLTMVMFRSLADVRGFAGDEIERPVIEPEADALLSRYDPVVTHYETVVTPDGAY